MHHVWSHVYSLIVTQSDADRPVVQCNMKFFFCVLVASLLALIPTCHAQLGYIIQNNVAGPPVNFQTVPWPIDPNAGERRRAEYEALNGRYGFKHVERVGLGEDGKAEERRRQQQLRDSVGGLSYRVPDS